MKTNTIAKLAAAAMAVMMTVSAGSSRIGGFKQHIVKLGFAGGGKEAAGNENRSHRCKKEGKDTRQAD